MYYNKKIEEIFIELKTTKDGLTNDKINKYHEKYGYNLIKEAKKKSSISRFIDQFKDMMIIILIIVAIIMGIYGFLYSHEYTDTIVITVVVLINAVMGFIQEQKAQVTLDGLKKYSTTTTKVKRNNQVAIIDAKDLVVGDIIMLEAGDKVPADARIIELFNLKVDESPLTGESVPVNKSTNVLKGKLQIQEQENMIFSGSNIVNGNVKAIVVAIGMNTELGRVAKSLNTPYEVTTPLQLKIQEISKKLTILIFIILIFMFIYGVLKGFEIMEIIMLCVSLAVAVIPEGLPAVITIALSAGTNSLAKKKTIVRQMSAVETLGSTDIICSDKTGTITQNKMQVVETKILDEKMMKYVALLANESLVDSKGYKGDPTEYCLYEHFAKNDIEVINIRKENHRHASLPFDSDRKMMSTINTINNTRYILVKGSPESILSHCKYITKNNKVAKLNKEDQKEINNTEMAMAKKALRVLAFAYKKIDESEKIDLNLENDLIYVGMVGMIDKARPSVKKSVQKCLKAGIRPVMITGDSFVTACAIAKEVGIIKSDEEGIVGDKLDQYTDDELKEVVKKYSVFVRVSPEHKSRIVKAWQANGKVVAMTGDGVNDAPAIKDAHVGVGMGITGTEVTKSVADVILLDDSFSTIVDAVEEGRRIFTNIRNNVVYSLSSNFAELFTVLIGMFTNNTILLPIHILFIDLVTDTIPSICLSFEKAEKNIMEQKPRGINKPIFTPFIKACIVYSAFIETLLALASYFIARNFFTPDIASTIALLTVVAQEIFYAYSCRNLKNGIYEQGLFSNKEMNIGIIVVLLIEVIFFLTPVGKIINITTISPLIFIIVFMVNTIGFILYELIKPILCYLFKD